MNTVKSFGTSTPFQIGLQPAQHGHDAVHDAGGHDDHGLHSPTAKPTSLSDRPSSSALAPANFDESPASRIPKTGIDKAVDAAGAMFRKLRKHQGVDHAAIDAIQKRREGPDWVSERNKSRKSSPLRDAAVASVAHHVSGFYQGGNR